MNIFGKVLVVVVFLLSIGFAVAQMILFEQRTQWRAEYNQEVERRRSVESDLSETRRRLERQTTELDTLRAEKRSEVDALTQRVQERDQRISRLESDLERRADELSQSQKNLELAQQRVAELDTIIKEHETKIAELEASKAQAEEEILALEEQIRTHVNTIDGLEKNIAELEEDRARTQRRLQDRERQLAELEARGVHIDIGKPLPAIDGMLSKVDNDIGVAILNRGEEHGVEINYDFVVYRDESFIARVYVMEVFPQHSLARVDRELTDLDTTPMRVGDKVTTRIR